MLTFINYTLYRLPVGLKKTLQKTFAHILKTLNNKEAYQMTLYFVNDDEIQALNKKWRKKNEPTDVLSFPSGELTAELPFPCECEQGKCDLGELFISLDTAIKQAQEWDHPLLSEIEVLFAHGVLHLFGFDHEKSAKQKKEMYDLQNAILKSV